MNKVKMTQKTYDELLKSIENNKLRVAIEYDPDDFHGKHHNTELNQVLAVWLGADHCEIEPEYEELSNTEAALTWAQKRMIEFKSQDGHWYEFTKVHDPRMFQDKLRPFRRKKP